jgi:hypothetical protein
MLLGLQRAVNQNLKNLSQQQKGIQHALQAVKEGMISQSVLFRHGFHMVWEN